MGEVSTHATKTTDNDVQSCATNTQQITTGSASCNDDSLMHQIEEDQRIAISVMCTNLHIAADDLLIEDVITHHEFMKVLADVAVSVTELVELSGMRVVATNLALQLQSCQAKLSKMTLLFFTCSIRCKMYS